MGSASAAGLAASLAGTQLQPLLLAVSLAILFKFFLALVRGGFTVDLLMGVAGLATWYMGVVTEGFLIFLLYSASELIEHQAEHYARKKIEGLSALLPDRVRVEVNGSIVEKALDEVTVGDIVVLGHGDVVPADGVVVGGEAVFDTSYITGEPEPRRIPGGGQVESGYINVGGMARIRVLKKPSESMLQLLIREAEEALERKTRLETMLERFAKPYTFALIPLFIVASILLTPYRGLAVLLAGCPSAFIIGSSTSTALSIALLARRSVVVRGGVVLENAARTKVVVLDKTGTVTLGELDVVGVVPLSSTPQQAILELAGGAVKVSRHPVAKALARHSNLSPRWAEERPGKGVEALVDGQRVVVGSAEFMEELGLDPPSICGEAERAVYVALNGRLAGAVCLGEKLSSNAEKLVEQLKGMGMSVVLASGDVDERVRSVAERLGIKEYYAGMKPQDKVELVRRLKTRGTVAMVGDGVNDAGALAEADVGIAVGDLNVSASVADAVLPKGVEGLPLIFRVARRFMQGIQSMLALALAVKLAVMAAGLAGAIPLWLVVGAGDDGSTILALLVSAGIIARK